MGKGRQEKKDELLEEMNLYKQGQTATQPLPLY